MRNGNETKKHQFDGKIFLSKREINMLVRGIDMEIRNECENYSRALYDGDRIELVLNPYFTLRKKLANYYEQLKG